MNSRWERNFLQLRCCWDKKFCLVVMRFMSVKSHQLPSNKPSGLHHLRWPWLWPFHAIAKENWGVWTAESTLAFRLSFLSWVILYCISEHTNSPLSEPKSHRPYTEFHSTHVVCCQINSWYCHNWCGGPLDVFCPGMEDTCTGDAALPRSSLGPGLATKLRLQLLSNRMENCWYLKGSPEVEEGSS